MKPFRSLAQVLTLQAGHRLALTLEVLEKEPQADHSSSCPQEPTLGGPPVSGPRADLPHCIILGTPVFSWSQSGGRRLPSRSGQLVMSQGILDRETIRAVATSRYESVLGGLSFSPASLRFDASFPGQAPHSKA